MHDRKGIIYSKGRRMKMNDLVSVIVPIYNVEKYLTRCVNSILEQTYSNLEIILVNDGSKDNCLEICKNLEEKDDRIVVVNKQNGGLGSARNAGIEASTGEYLLFIDSDDYIDERMVERLHSLLNETNASIAACDFLCFFEDGSCEKKTKRNNVITYSKEDALKYMFWSDKIRWSAWNKLYKRELFESVRYAEGVYSEDMATTYLLYEQCDKIVWTEECYYYYFIRNTGIMKSRPPKRYADEIDIIEQICEHYKKYHQDLLFYPQAFYGKIALNNYIGIGDNVEYISQKNKCIEALYQYGGLALKAEFVRTKYKILIGLVVLPIRITKGKFANGKLFNVICRKVRSFIK